MIDGIGLAAGFAVTPAGHRCKRQMRLSRLGTDSSLPPDYQGFRGRAVGDESASQNRKFESTTLQWARLIETGRHARPRKLVDTRRLDRSRAAGTSRP